jgi:hypothetical protein
LGRIGYEGQFDYAAIGSVTNLAAVVRRAVRAECWHRGGLQAVGRAVSGSVGALKLRGFSRSVRAYGVSEMINNSAEVPQ